MTINWAAVDDVADSTPKLMFLMCLEAILGVLNACLPVLKPVFSKVCCAIKNFNVKKIRSISWKTHSTSAIIQVSQMWESRSKKHSRGGELDSTISVQGLRRSEGSIQSTSMAERVVGTKVFEIHVQNDIHVSSGRPSLGSHIV